MADAEARLLVEEEDCFECEHEADLRRLLDTRASSGGGAASVVETEAVAEAGDSSRSPLLRIGDFPGATDARLQHFVEHPGFFTDILLPFYSSLNVPGILLKEWAGGRKFFNRCVRAGLTKLIEAPEGTGHGAFLLMLNPGYHDPVAAAVRAHRHKRGLPEETHAALTRAIEAAEAAGPCAPVDLSGGAAFVAWWVQPSLVPGLQRTLGTLQREALYYRTSAPDDREPPPTADSVEAAMSALAAQADTVAAAAAPAWGAETVKSSGASSAAAGGACSEAAAAPALAAPVFLRAPSEHNQVADFSLDGRLRRDEGYLHTMRDLRASRDAPLLKALLEQGTAFVSEKAGQPPARFGLHYPYEPFYSTLHVHVQTVVYPNSSGGSGRRQFAVEDILRAWDGGAGEITLRSLVNMWWPRGEPAMQFLMELAGGRVTECEDGVVEFR